MQEDGVNKPDCTEAEREWLERREARFAALERLCGARPPYTETEVEADIAEAITAVRSKRAV